MRTTDLEHSFMQYFGSIAVQDFPMVANYVLVSAKNELVMTQGELFMEAVADFCEEMIARNSNICSQPLDMVIEEYHYAVCDSYEEFVESEMKEWLSQWATNHNALEEGILPFIDKKALADHLRIDKDAYIFSNGHVFKKEI